MTLLQARQLTTGVSNRLLCNALEMTVQPGECWGILGPNGSGKSTLLHTLAGLLTPQGGEVTLQGTPLQKLPRVAIARALSLLLQDSHDTFPATVLETALSGRHPHLGRWQLEGEADRQIARAALARMELDEMASRQVQTLSGGERRRLAFATQLTQAAPLMLLDEPLNHLDIRHQQLLLSNIRQLCGDGHGVVMVLHDPNQALGYCDRVLLLDGDGGWQAGESGELLTAERLEELYGCHIEKLETNGQRWFRYL